MDDDDDPFSLDFFAAPPKPTAVQPKPVPTPAFTPSSITYYDDSDPFSVDLPPFSPAVATKLADTKNPKVDEIQLNAIKDFRIDPSGNVELHVEWRTPGGVILSWESRDALFAHIPDKQLERFSPPNAAITNNTRTHATQPNPTQQQEHKQPQQSDKKAMDTSNSMLPDRPKTPEQQYQSWTGTLEKGGRTQCSLSTRWLQSSSPTTIIQKINVAQKCQRVKALKQPLVGVLEMVPSNPGDTANFKKFVDYLRQKDRVGSAVWEDLVIHVCVPDSHTLNFLQQLMIDVPQNQKFENYVLYGIVSRKSVQAMHNQT